jgi:hypothetical protein
MAAGAWYPLEPVVVVAPCPSEPARVSAFDLERAQ